jgi:hypothetical protein
LANLLGFRGESIGRGYHFRFLGVKSAAFATIVSIRSIKTHGKILQLRGSLHVPQAAKAASRQASRHAAGVAGVK